MVMNRLAHQSLTFTLAGVSCLALAGAAWAQACPADLSGNGTVDGTDLSALLADWGPCIAGTACTADLNGDGQVNAVDLAMTLAAWGTCSVTVPGWASLVEAQPDPAVVTSAALRAAIEATGLAWRVRDVSTQIEMVLIPPGTFSMGCSASLQSACLVTELPVHEVMLTRPFYLARHEVTQSQWTAQMGANPSQYQGEAYPDAPAHPVERVSHADAQAFNALVGMRLPTEAEWEFACRAGTATAFHGWPANPEGTSDEALAAEIGWIRANNGPSGSPTFGTKVVGQKAPNGFGLHDMCGNVGEWVSDWYDPNYYASSPAVDPAGPGPGNWLGRGIRGGNWNSATVGARSSSRAVWFSQLPTVGFRVARDP